ncbi:hypothetical protein WJX77_012036 [Trebouxia sp. C0004]
MGDAITHASARFFIVISGLILRCRSRKLYKRRQAQKITHSARLPAVEKHFSPPCGVQIEFARSVTFKTCCYASPQLSGSRRRLSQLRLRSPSAQPCQAAFSQKHSKAAGRAQIS